MFWLYWCIEGFLESLSRFFLLWLLKDIMWSLRYYSSPTEGFSNHGVTRIFGGLNFSLWDHWQSVLYLHGVSQVSLEVPRLLYDDLEELSGALSEFWTQENFRGHSWGSNCVTTGYNSLWQDSLGSWKDCCFLCRELFKFGTDGSI